MRKTLRTIVAAILTIAVFLCGCAEAERIAGLHYDVDGIPKIETFSGEKIESYKYHFSPVVCAVLHRGGEQEDISAEDPKLIRLLNFIAYSEEECSCWWLQGYAKPEEAEALYGSADYLEVWLQPATDTSTHTFSQSHRLIVCRDTILMYYNGELIGLKGELIERCYPYMEHFSQAADQGSVTEAEFEQVAASSGNYGEPWLDLLTAAGFEG